MDLGEYEKGHGDAIAGQHAASTGFAVESASGEGQERHAEALQESCKKASFPPVGSTSRTRMGETRTRSQPGRPRAAE
eukprot:3961781-Pyramimonas_sp.AAC.1